MSLNMFSFLNRWKEEPHLGFVPNPEQDNDPRNLLYEEIAPLGAVSVPESGDVEKGTRTTYQGQSSSCTCHSATYAVEQATGRKESPRYAFKRVKSDPKYPSSQLTWGAYMVDPLKLRVGEGICEISLVDESKTRSDAEYLSLEITDSMKISAERGKGGSYLYVTSGNDSLKKFDDIIRFMHEQRLPVLVGVDWRTSFNNARRDGVVPATMPSGKISGHAMEAVAWKRINGHEYLGFRNSFGSTWGDKGRIWLPKGFLRISTALAYLPPITIDIPKPEPVQERNIYLEKASAEDLRKMLALKFPLNVNTGSQDANYRARSLAGRMWLVLVPAVTYRKWTVKDVENYLWAQSRNLNEELAYFLDFNKTKGR